MCNSFYVSLDLTFQTLFCDESDVFMVNTMMDLLCDNRITIKEDILYLFSWLNITSSAPGKVHLPLIGIQISNAYNYYRSQLITMEFNIYVIYSVTWGMTIIGQLLAVTWRREIIFIDH